MGEYGDMRANWTWNLTKVRVTNGLNKYTSRSYSSKHQTPFVLFFFICFYLDQISEDERIG